MCIRDSLIPVHLGMHWCLATVDFTVPGVFYYDSMGGNNSQCYRQLLQGASLLSVFVFSFIFSIRFYFKRGKLNYGVRTTLQLEDCLKHAAKARREFKLFVEFV